MTAQPLDATAIENLRLTLTALLAAELSAATELRHALHRNPELSGAERATAVAVAGALGCPDAPPIAGTTYA